MKPVKTIVVILNLNEKMPLKKLPSRVERKYLVEEIKK